MEDFATHAVKRWPQLPRRAGWSGWAGCALALFLGSCGGPASSDGPSGRIDVEPAKISIAISANTALSAHVFNADGVEVSAQGVFWSTENASVATVNSSGVVTGVGPGTVKIAASQGGQSGISQVTVVPKAVALVRLQPSDGSVFVGRTMQLRAIPISASGEELTGRTAVWSSSSPATATVNSSGVVTGVGAGAVTIRATVEGIEGTASLSVLQVPIAAIVLSPAPASVEERKNVQLTATARDASGATVTGRTIIWSSSSDAVVGVSQTGLVTGIAPGTATITASAPGAAADGSTPSGTVAVTVQYAPVASVRVLPVVTSVAVGASTPFSATLLDAAGQPLSAAGRTLSWTSLDPSRASINASTGVATGVSIGTARIRASAFSPGQGAPLTGDATLTVTTIPVSSVTVVPSTETVHVGPTYARTFTAMARDAAGNVISDRSVVWTSSNQNVATAAATTGLVTGVTPGTASITATVDGVSGAAAVTVDLVSIVSASIAPASMNLAIPGTQLLNLTLRDSAGAPITGSALGSRGITWSSSNTAVATVSAIGIVTAVAPGNATISVLAGLVVGTATVSVLGVVNAVALAVSPDSVMIPGSTGGSATVRDVASNPLAGKSVSLASSSPSVATVSPATATTNASGQVVFTVTAVATGTATITATSDGKSGAQPVRVVLPQIVTASTVSLSILPDSIVLPGTTSGSATVRGSSSQVLAGRAVSLTSSAPTVATVVPATATTNSLGQVTFSVVGVTAGTTTITATSDGKSAGQGVRVVVPVVATNSVTVSATPDSIVLPGGVSGSVTVLGPGPLFLPLVGRAVSLTSSAPGVATVSPASGTTSLSGQVSFSVTGVAVGTTTITATSGGKSGTFVVRVVLASVNSVGVSPSSMNVKVGDSKSLTATARDANNTPLSGRACTIASSDATRATVSPASASTNGSGQVSVSVSGVKTGTVTVTVTCQGKSGSASVTVTP